MSEKPSFFSELKRRNVYKVAVAYIVAGWPLSQVASTSFSGFRHSKLGCSCARASYRDRIPDCAGHCVGI